MREHRKGLPQGERGITGLETAIILIAFVVVAAVFAFTVLSTGVFSAERSKETIYAGLQEAKSSLEPRGSIIAYSGGYSTGPTTTIYKVSFVVANAVAGEPIDLTPPYSSDATGLDPDYEASNEYRTVISYTDQNQYLADVPWTIDFIGNDSGDNLLESGEKAEISVWLLARNGAVSDAAAANGLIGWEADARGAHGILTSGTILTTNDQFTIEVKPDVGAVMTVQRTVPVRLDTVMDLK